MPPVSEAQRRAMHAAAEGKSKLGIPKKVGEEFVGKDGAPQAAGVVFVAPDGDVLLLRRSSDEENWAGHWSLPGGKADGAETPEQAADREIKEEIGDVPTDRKRLMDRRETPNGMVFSTFAHAVDEKFVPKLNDEHSGYAWARLDQLPGPLHPAVKDVLGAHIGVAEDMSPEDWEGLQEGFAKWTREEEREPEHAERRAHDSLAFDRASVREYDADGRLHVERTPISKANVCEYWGREIPGAEQLGLDLDRKYRLLRHPDELRKGADTFNNLPILKRHVPVSAGDHRPEDVVGSTGTDAAFEHPYLVNSMVVWAKDDIDDIEKNLKRELSSAYRYRADMTAGDYEGEPYDGIMRDIVGNHVAIVKEGRAGPDVLVGDSIEGMNMPKVVLTRKAALVQGALTAYLAPLMAQDANVEVASLLADVNAKNYASKRPAIVAGVTKLTSGKLAKDAKLDGLDKVLMALDAVEPEEEEKKAEDAEDLPEVGGGKGKGPAGAKDRRGRDSVEDLKEKLKGKMSAEDWKAACDDIDGMADAEDAEPEDAGKSAKDRKGKDEETVTKEDVGKAMDEAIAGERQRQRDVREAERVVRAWVGDLAIAYDSADDVYKAALEARGKSTKGIHPSAYRTILEMLPKPGSERRETARVAMDSAGTKSFAEMYPGAMSIRVNA